MTATCGTCKYIDILEGYLSGFCHRYPPVVINRHEVTLFPIVSKNDWCGEYSGNIHPFTAKEKAAMIDTKSPTPIVKVKKK